MDMTGYVPSPLSLLSAVLFPTLVLSYLPKIFRRRFRIIEDEMTEFRNDFHHVCVLFQLLISEFVPDLAE
jgi:hypothetical protein